jgi:septum formation protein
VTELHLILASASPARTKLLTDAGIAHSVLVSDVDEDAVTARYGVTDPADTALLLARAKAEAVASLPDAEGALVLGCDSVFELDGEPYGKPYEADVARQRWQRMSGRHGVLHTGHWLIDEREPAVGGTGGTLGATSSTVVHFADLSDEEIDAYVATGEPLAVAGAFTVDGLGGAFVTRIEGDHHGVVGVSLPLLRELLGEVGLTVPHLWSVVG